MGVLGRIAVAAVVAVFALPAGANAAFPGTNGKIAFERQNFSPNVIDLVSPDGTGRVACCQGLFPAWSPDGQRLAYEDQFGDLVTSNRDGTDQQLVRENFGGDFEGISWSPDGGKLAFDLANCLGGCGPFIDGIYVINVDGTNLHCVICDPASGNFDPAWSPDGNRLAFVSDREGSGNTEIYVSDLSGSVQTRLTNTAQLDLYPSWSPSGHRIAFASNRDENFNSNLEIYSMNSDGSDVKRLTQDPAHDFYPAWSPDGATIAFTSSRNDPNPSTCNPCQFGIYTINGDGTGPTPVTTDALNPDWQPIPYTGYARPRGAGPFKTYLVPAYKPCIPPGNRTHGAPLAFPSCAPPQQASDWLTVGTSDSNGQQNRSIGSVTFKPRLSPADVSIEISITDVRNKADLSDYTGEVQALVQWRLTDRYNGPSLTEPATMQDIPFPTAVYDGCGATADTTVGSTCAISTSANAVLAGAIRGHQRMIIELGQVEVWDGGSDGVNATPADNTLFMDQGVFIP